MAEHEERRIGVVVTGGKYVDPVTGNRYWWPDDVAPPPPGTEPPRLPDTWVDLGYTVDPDADAADAAALYAEASKVDPWPEASTDPVVTTDDCPECRGGKHPNCSGFAFDADDKMVPCPCAEGGHL